MLVLPACQAILTQSGFRGSGIVNHDSRPRIGDGRQHLVQQATGQTITCPNGPIQTPLSGS